MNFRTTCLLAAIAFAGLSPVVPAAAQGFPAREVRLVVPFVPGGIGDLVARALSSKLGTAWGVPVLVENRPGANGNIGAAQVAKAPADGYTLLVTEPAIMTTNPDLYSDLPYSAKDFAPIANLVMFPQILVAPTTSPLNSLKDLLGMDKGGASRLNVASSGTGLGPHLALEKFKSLTGLPLRHVPYKGAGQAIQDVVGGHVDLMFTSGPVAGPLLDQGRIKALGVTASKRARFAPQVPTFAEAGMAFEWLSRVSLFAPAGTPPPIIEKVYTDAMAALREPDVQSRLTSAGLELDGNSTSHFAAWIGRESEDMRALIRAANIRID